ncbi:MAG: N-acetyltransferase family protein [Pseudomonadales bacterium]|nr:N-acetyltransferase family protein [Pseudomonadales bacterium]
MHIREGSAGDLPSLTDLYNHYVVNTAITFDLEPFTVEARSAWFERFGRTPRHRLLVLDDGSSLLGYACSGALRPKAAYDRSVETSIYLDPAHCGQGHGRRLYGALLDLLAEAGVHRCYGVITAPNPASEQLHRSLGFQPIGRMSECGRKFDRWWDVIWMERTLGAS